MHMIALNLTPLDVTIMAAAFGLVLAIWYVAMLMVSLRRAAKRRTVRDRLALGEQGEVRSRTLRLWSDGEEATTVVPVAQTRPSIVERLDDLRASAGWHAPWPTIALGLFGGSTLLAAISYALTRQWLVAVVAFCSVFIVFWVCLKAAISRYTALFERQFVGAMELASRSLRAGHPLVGAFQLIAQEVAPPVCTIFGQICQQQAMGIGLERALRQAAEKTHSEDMKLFATSVAIQLHSGGNLADMMERLAAVVRDRMRLNRRVRVLTAQTQFSKRVLIALPFVLFVLLNLINPGYMGLLYTTRLGQFLLLLAGAGILLGSYVMNRMAVLRY